LAKKGKNTEKKVWGDTKKEKILNDGLVVSGTQKKLKSGIDVKTRGLDLEGVEKRLAKPMTTVGGRPRRGRMLGRRPGGLPGAALGPAPGDR